MADTAELRELTRQVPAHFLHNPFPMTVATVPLAAGGRTFGCLSVRWSRTRRPDAPIARDELHHLRAVAQDLAADLLRLAEAGCPMEAPPIPLFVRPPAPQSPQAGGAPTAVVPALAGDVHDLDGLRLVGELLAHQAL